MLGKHTSHLAFRFKSHKIRYLMYRLAVILVIIIIASSAAEAKPRKGFHTGPYLALEAGVMQEDFDRDQVTGLDIGRNFEPTFGFLFGWNIWDYFSGELQGRYATNINAGRREHIAAADAYARYTFILDALTNFTTLRILPFIKGGGAVRISALPGTINSSNNTVTRIGTGPSIGAGISFLWKKYFYFGIDAQESLLFFSDIDQTVNGIPGTLVYKGGFHPSFSVMGMVGVHY